MPEKTRPNSKIVSHFNGKIVVFLEETNIWDGTQTYPSNIIQRAFYVLTKTEKGFRLLKNRNPLPIFSLVQLGFGSFDETDYYLTDQGITMLHMILDQET